MANDADGVNDKALIEAEAGIIRALRRIASQVEKTRQLQDAYEGKCSFEGNEVEGDVDALKAIAAACNAPTESIYAELMNLEPFVRKLRAESEKAKRRAGLAEGAKQEHRKAARARREAEKEQERKGVEALMDFMNGGK